MSQLLHVRADDLIIMILDRVKARVGKPLLIVDLDAVPRQAYEWLQDHSNNPFISESDTGERFLNPELSNLLKGWL